MDKVSTFDKSGLTKSDPVYNKAVTHAACRPLTDAPTSKGKIHPFSKIAITYDHIMQFDILRDLE